MHTVLSVLWPSADMAVAFTAATYWVLAITLSRPKSAKLHFMLSYTVIQLTLDFWDLQFWQALATRRRFKIGGSAPVLQRDSP
jgi:hypothetical protein